jgi:hypothetical protein
MVRAFCTSSSGVFLTDYLDVISEYCFGKSSHRVEAKDFDPSQHNLAVDAGHATTVNRHFPLVPQTLLSLPSSIAVLIGGGLASVTQSKKVRIALYLHFDGCREIAQGLIGSRDSMPILRE